MSTVQTALLLGAAELKIEGSLDAQLLLAHVLGKSRTWLYTWPEKILSVEQELQFFELITLRVTGHPIAYLLGNREFWNFELEVNPAVLIPRHETEILVELALELATNTHVNVADLGTGSGAIALALAFERPNWEIVATDLYPAALDVARSNIIKLGLTNLRLVQGSWCEPLVATDFDVIVSNPPYIEPNDPHLLQGDLRFEPHTALVSAGKGLDDIRQISHQALTRLRPAGYLLLEHGWLQGEAVRSILEGLGYTKVTTYQDHIGKDRVTVGRR